jgi:hypothetical protein
MMISCPWLAVLTRVSRYVDNPFVYAKIAPSLSKNRFFLFSSVNTGLSFLIGRENFLLRKFYRKFERK